MSDQQGDLDIAIIGMAGRFPGASSVEAFWERLRAGAESIRDLSDQELRAAGVDAASLSDPRYVRRAADLSDVSLFDAALFGFTPREAELTDPQFRVLLEDAWTALEDAGHLTDRRDCRVGVFAGASPGSYLSGARAARFGGSFQAALGNERDYLATQISYRLDLRGPSVLVQTACSTSLVAVHLACQSLIGRECDVALAGGVSISVPQTAGYLHEEGDIASPDGRCRAFDAAAAGCVKGNGSGVVVLRRLADALRDGDAIRAVIKGSAINNDGSIKVGFTAPSVDGQAEVIAEALAVAGVDPSTVTCIEAHGTATPLGDPVEVAALARAFGRRDAGALRCALGSVKTNIGHLDAAAGVAGLIKMVLSLQKKEIPPSLHFQRPNPQIDFSRTPFFVNTQLRAWEHNGAPRRAGVSSFGIGGTNAHVVLEEAPAPAPRADEAGDAAPQLLVVSAAGEPALATLSQAIASHLESPDADLAGAAWTLQAGRRRLAWRRTVVARDARAAAAALRAPSPSRVLRHDERRGTEVAFLFPGQGAQRAGMGRVLHRDEPVFRKSFDRCVALLGPDPGAELAEAVLTESPELDERLKETRLAQPALFVVSYALAQLWIARGVRPSAMAGHSVGEYVAACLAGVMSLEDALALVAERGRMMGSLPPGAMLAVPLDEAALAARLEGFDTVAIAAVNAPASCVASGPPDAIDRLEARLSSEGVACRRLRTSHAFHSSMMDPIVGPFERRARAARLSAPGIPFLSNVSGSWITAGEATDPAYWARHIRRTVRFADQVAALRADSSRALLEVGPGTTLTSLARAQAGSEAPLVASLGRPTEGRDDRIALLEAAGALWCAGVDLKWEAFHPDRVRRRVPLPTYPFQRQSYWIEDAGEEGAERDEDPGKNPDRAAWFWVPGWKRSVARPAAEGSGAETWLILDDGSPLGRALADRATLRGARVVLARAGEEFARPDSGLFLLDPARRDHVAMMARALAADGIAPGRLVHLWCTAETIDPQAARERGFHALIHLLQEMVPPAGGSGQRLLCVTRGLFDVAGEPVSAPERAMLAGICRVAPLEIPGLVCRLVDVTSRDAGTEAEQVLREIESTEHEPVAAWRGGHRFVPVHTHVRVEEPARDPEGLPPGGAFVLTGGAGTLEMALARKLAASGARGLIFLMCGDEHAEEMAALRAAGAEVLCSPVSPDNPAGLPAVLAEARARFGRLDAVLHTAGSIGGGMIHLKERSAAERVLSPRLDGARLLAGLLRENETLVLFSSAISATGVFGQVDYCAASAFLDAFAQQRRAASGPRVVTVDWGMALWDRWQEAPGPGGAALMEQLREIQSSIGITVDEGVDALWRALSLGEPQVVVCVQDLDALVAQASSSAVAEFLESARPASRAHDAGGSAEAPATDTERAVARAWTDLLGVSPIGRRDNFFELGGNSLLAIQLASGLRKSFGIELSIASLFESADLAATAAAVDRAIADRQSQDEVARLLDEIERLSEQEVLAELERSAETGVAGT